MQISFPNPLQFKDSLSKEKGIISRWLNFKFKSRFHKFIAMILAVLVAIPAGWALADEILFDGDTITAGNQSTVQLYAKPGAMLTPKVSFQLDCKNNNHVDAGKTATLTYNSGASTVPAGSLSATNATIGTIPASWPDDGQQCPNPAPAPINDNGDSTVTITAPLNPGSYFYVVKYDPSLNYDDGKAIPNTKPTVTYNVQVENAKPSITLTTPSNGATYTKNQAVNAAYTCADETGGSGIQSCTGTVANGSAIDTSTTGTKNFTVTATDKAGNTETKSATYTVVSPNTAPTTPGAPALLEDLENLEIGSSNPNQGVFTLGWTGSTDVDNDPITYTIQHKDANDVNFSDSRTGQKSNSYWFPIHWREDEGTWTYRVLASDGTASSAFSGASNAIKVDHTEPTATASFDPATPVNGSGGWYNGSVTVSYNTSTDPALQDGSAGSGVASYSQAQTFTNSGTHSYSGRATDNVGHQSLAATGSVKVDVTKPVTTPTATTSDGSSYSSGTWTNETVTVDLDATDAHSGLKAITYEINGGTTQTYSSTNKLTVSAEGEKTITFRATDYAGNVEADKTLTVKLDKTAPTVTDAGTTQQANTNGWYNTDVTNKFTASDSTSGLANPTTDASFSKTTTGEGSAVKVSSGTVKDVAGNEAVAVNSAAYQIDKTNPSISHTLTPSSPASTGWYNISTGAPKVHFDCTDALSGIQSCPADYTFGEGSNLSTSGTAYDKADNSKSDSVTGIYVDLTAPKAVAAPDLMAADDTGSSSTDNETNVKTPRFTGKAEANSTVTLYDESTKVGSANADAEGNWTIKTSTLGEGEHSMTAKATDAAGNDSAWSPTVNVTIVTVDSIAPAAPSAPDLLASHDSGTRDNDDITSFNQPKFSGTAEAGSTVDLFKGTTSLGTTTADSTSGAWSFTVPSDKALADGTYSIAAKATDTAGNTSANYSSALSVTIDTTAPAITNGGASASADGNAGWYKTAVTNKFSASDTGGSGLADSSQENFTKSSGPQEGGAVKISSGSVSDVAGNSNPGINSAAFKIDLTAPVISGADVNDTTWRNTDLSASFTASDSVSDLYSSASDASFTLTASDESTATTPTTVSRTVYDVAGHSATRTLSARIDKTAPTVKDGGPTANANAAGWYKTDVTNNFTASDSLSGLFDSNQASFSKTTTGEGLDLTVSSGDVYDKAGNKASVTSTQFDVDKTKPTLNPSVSPNPVLLNGSATVSAGASDSLSGLTAAATCGSVDTSSVGSKSVSCSATDNAGNSNSATASYSVNYKWDGFRQPVDNNGVFNVAKAGSAIPLKFSLSGNQGLSVITGGVPKVTQVNCSTSAPTDTLEEISATTNSGLSYDATADQYNYVWKTQSTFAGKCYKLDMQLIDGTSHVAYFKFTK